MREPQQFGGALSRVLPANSLCLTAWSAVDAGDALFSFARALAAQGCTLHSQSAQGVTLYRFDTLITPLLVAAYTAVRRAPISASAIMAVKVTEDGVRKPSDKTVEFGAVLAAEARPGQLVMSLRLASLLQATEPDCSAYMRPDRVPMAGGGERAVVQFHPVREPVDRPATLSPFTGVLPPDRAKLLAERISLRLRAVAPTITASDVIRVVDSGAGALQVAGILGAKVSGDLRTSVQRIVEDEFRSINLRGRPRA